MGKRSQSYLQKLGITDAEFSDLIRDNPSLRGVIVGYVAELKLTETLSSLSQVTCLAKPDDHDRTRKGDRVIEYCGEPFILECKSLQTKTIKQIDGRWEGQCQCDASDCRDIILSNGNKVRTTLLEASEFDVLAVNIWAFEEKWRFVFAKNSDLPTTKSAKYAPEDRVLLIASMVSVTWPPEPPFTDYLPDIFDELLLERKSTR